MPCMQSQTIYAPEVETIVIVDEGPSEGVPHATAACLDDLASLLTHTSKHSNNRSKQSRDEGEDE